MKTVQKIITAVTLSSLMTWGLVGCSETQEETDSFFIVPGNFWEYTDSLFDENGDTTVGRSRFEVLEVLPLDTLGLKEIFSAAWYENDTTIQPYTWLYAVTKEDGLLRVGGMSPNDTMLVTSVNIVPYPILGSTWQSIVVRYNLTDNHFYYADTVTVECTKVDTILQTTSIYGAIHAQEYQYQIVDPVAHSGDSVVETVYRYYARGYGNIGFAVFEGVGANKRMVSKKVLYDMEQKHH